MATPRKPRLPERLCDWCGAIFVPWRSDQRFCSTCQDTRWDDGGAKFKVIHMTPTKTDSDVWAFTVRVPGGDLDKGTYDPRNRKIVWSAEVYQKEAENRRLNPRPKNKWELLSVRTKQAQALCQRWLTRHQNEEVLKARQQGPALNTPTDRLNTRTRQTYIAAGKRPFCKCGQRVHSTETDDQHFHCHGCGQTYPVDSLEVIWKVPN